jgi:hypothetical protein
MSLRDKISERILVMESTATDADLLKVVGEILNKFKSERSSFSGGGQDSPTLTNQGADAGLRYWGQWQTPSDAEGDGDYDWQELTSASAAKANAHIKEFQAKHPNMKITWQTGEKNWITFYVSRK